VVFVEMNMFALLLLLSASLLLYGCAQQQSPPAAPSPQPPSVPSQPPEPSQEQPSPPANTSEAPASPPSAAPSDTCTVEFQKDTSSIYYVMVKTDSAKQLSVACPNGKDGEKQGGLYFCSSLDVDSPAIAYLDGKECGRAQFSMPSPPSGAQQCKVLLAPSRITMGGTTVVSVTAYVPQERSRLTYNCGSAVVNESAGGMVDTGRICTFSQPGTIEVSAAINGVQCASSLLEVFATSKDCSVYGSKFSMDKGQYVYTAQVAARGYSSGDELRYKCYGVPFAIKAGTLPNTTDFVATIECRSASGPLSQNVPVSMNSDACGELEVPQ